MSLLWSELDEYCLISEGGRYTIAKTFGGSDVVYLAWRITKTRRGKYEDKGADLIGRRQADIHDKGGRAAAVSELRAICDQDAEVAA